MSEKQSPGEEQYLWRLLRRLAMTAFFNTSTGLGSILSRGEERLPITHAPGEILHCVPDDLPVDREVRTSASEHWHPSTGRSARTGWERAPGGPRHRGAHARSFLSILAFLLLGATTLLGCEEDLPTREHFETPFSLYGVLSPDLDTQSVRIYAIEDFPTLGSDSIDAVVTSKDVTTGETRTWTDSVIVDPNGQHEHVFWSPFRAEYGHTYHVEVSRPSDGATSVAEARVPTQVTVEIDLSQRSDLYITIEGENIQPLKPEVVYTLQKPFIPPNTFYPILTYAISYEGQQQQVAKGWLIHVRPDFDRARVQSWYNLDAPAKTGLRCRALLLRDFRFRAMIGDSIWNPPGGVFDRNILSHPKAMSNVQGGFGFIGAGYRINVDLDLSQEAVEEACFIYFDPTS